jgi:translation initiation factor 4G
MVYRYDRDFLLQFMSICREKPDMLPPLDAIGLEPSDQTFAMHRTHSGRHRQPSSQPPTPRQPSVGLGFNTSGGFGKPSAIGNFTFSGGSGKMSSEERFAAANTGRLPSGSIPPNMQQYSRPSQMVRSTSQGGPGSSMGSGRTRSRRGEKRNDPSKAGPSGGQQTHGSQFGPSGPSYGPGGVPLEPVVPLELSANRWTPASISRKPQAADAESPEMVDRKVKGLLNKLTMEKFDSISDQIIAWANKSEKEKDGRTLIQVIRLVFEKATDEAAWSEMYSRLCRKMMEQISSKVQDDGIKNQEGKPIAGGQLFRKYLLNRCQEDFERGWVAKEATAAAAATKSIEDQAAKAANEKNKEDGNEGSEEMALYSDEYYAVQTINRYNLFTILVALGQFISHL